MDHTPSSVPRGTIEIRESPEDRPATVTWPPRTLLAGGDSTGLKLGGYFHLCGPVLGSWDKEHAVNTDITRTSLAGCRAG